MKNNYIAILSLLLCIGCGANSGTKKVETNKAKTFKYVQVPPIISNQTEALTFLATHFWDNFDFADTSFISLPKELEQAVSNYVDALSRVDSSVSYKSFADVIKKSEVDTAMFRYMTDQLQSYVGDPNSPLRNNILHINLLKVLLSNANIDPTERIAYEHKLKINSKNMKGTRAVDFKYFTRDGHKGSLYGLKSDYTIIFFNHLGCNACAEVKSVLESDELIGDLLKEKRLTILGIFPDEDKSEWLKDNSQFAKQWINAADTDSQIEKSELYYIPAIPSLYLLDKNKTVILKDSEVGDVLFVLNQLVANP